MTSTPMLLFMALFLLESLAAMLQNGFMAAVLGWQWVRGLELPAADMIVACLAASRFALHGMSVLNSYLIILNSLYKVYYFHVIWGFINTLTFWLTALLSIFYCVKIASFSHPTFLWLRWRLSRSVPRLLLGSLAVSFLTSIPLAMSFTLVSQMGNSQTLYINASWTDPVINLHWKFIRLHQTLVLSMPFLLFLVSTVLLVFSLGRHLHQMRGDQPGPRDPSTQAHITALKSLGFFLVFYTAYFLTTIVYRMIMPLHRHWFWACQAVIYAGISLHSTLLLVNSPRLRRTLKGRLQRCRTTGCGGLNRVQVPPETQRRSQCKAEQCLVG